MTKPLAESEAKKDHDAERMLIALAWECLVFSDFQNIHEALRVAKSMSRITGLSWSIQMRHETPKIHSSGWWVVPPEGK